MLELKGCGMDIIGDETFQLPRKVRGYAWGQNKFADQIYEMADALPAGDLGKLPKAYDIYN